MGISIGRPQVTAPTPKRTKVKQDLGAASLPRDRGRTLRESGAAFRSTSAGAGSSTGNMQTGTVPLDIDLSPMMEGMDYDADDRQLFNVYRDMYHFDPICGSFVDLFSTLPFSDVSLSGAKDSVLDPYYEVMDRLSLIPSMPNITTDILVTGAYVGSMLYNKERKKFIDMMTHRYDNIKVTPFPFMSQDPMFELIIPREIKTALSKEGKRIDLLERELGAAFIDKLRNDVEMELDPLGTIYIPRKTFTFGEGVSAFRRCLPIWLIEKNLYRGTLIESGKRQRSILHAQLGDGNEWEPSTEEMEFITDLILSADADPLGAVITTRLGVNISEFRAPTDFWKITDIWDQTAPFKMRALGISEALLSGEANYEATSTGLTVFTEYMRSFRDHLTRQTFYRKIFPIISMLNGYAVSPNGKITKKSGMMDGDLAEISMRLKDGSKLFIPTVHWSKQLRPDADQSMMENLRAMTELGVPVPLRVIAAAGGFNFDSILQDQDEDMALRRKLLSVKKRQMDLEKEYGAQDDGMGSFSSTSSNSSALPILGAGMGSSVLGNAKRPSLMRDYGEHAEIFEIGKTGKKKHVIRQARANHKANDQIYKAAQNYEKNKRSGLDDGITRKKGSFDWGM